MSSLKLLEKVCGDLHEFIFLHFDTSTVLKASKVSPEWNAAISKSPKCMAQVSLKFGESKVAPRVINRSKRHYNDLSISIGSYDNVDQKFKLVEKFAQFLKKLVINNGAFDKREYHQSNIISVGQNVHLPKLESLIIRYNPIAFVNVTSLKKLSLCNLKFNRMTVEWIQSQQKLDVLKLYGKESNFFSFDPIAPKGLKQFKCDFTADAATLNNFLKPICDSLTVLKIRDYIDPANLELIVNEMPNLKTLLFYMTDEDIVKAKLKSNSSITSLSMPEPRRASHFLMLSLANLEELTVFRIDVARFEWIARNLMKLKKLKSWRCEPSYERFVERYNEMKASEEGINTEIEIVLEE
jgi:hypothetical protein